MGIIKERSEKLYKEAVQYLPGGVNSPVRAFRSVMGHPLFMKKGEGAHIFDEDGNEFIDYCMSWGPLILGHADDEVIKAVRDAATLGTSFGTPHRFEVELAKMVIDSYPGMEKVRFVNSGTEATMSAIRLARGYTGREKIIKFDGCYHGHADYLLVAAGSGLATFGTPDSAGVNKDNAKDTMVVPYNDIAQLEKVMKESGDQVAACIMEPVPCNLGLILPDEGYLQKVRELCDSYGVVLIFDEVITGFRLARGGAQEFMGVQADITTLGKIIGGGLSVGAYGGKKEIMAKVAPDGPVYQAGTLAGNPLAMAAGIATLGKLFRDDAYTVLEKKAARFKELLSGTIETYKGRVLFQQLGSIFAIYFNSLDRVSTVDQVKESNMQQFAVFHNEMLERGVYLSPSGFEVGFLSVKHSDEDLQKTAKAITESLEVVFSSD